MLPQSVFLPKWPGGEVLLTDARDHVKQLEVRGPSLSSAVMHEDPARTTQKSSRV